MFNKGIDRFGYLVVSSILYCEQIHSQRKIVYTSLDYLVFDGGCFGKLSFQYIHHWVILLL
jgi:hypothetical protein